MTTSGSVGGLVLHTVMATTVASSTASAAVAKYQRRGAAFAWTEVTAFGSACTAVTASSSTYVIAGGRSQPPRGVFFETALNQMANGDGDIAWQRLPVRRALQDVRQRLRHVVAAERARAGEHFEQDAAERPHIDAFVDHLAARLLRCHIGSRAEDHPVRRHRGTGDRR